MAMGRPGKKLKKPHLAGMLVMVLALFAQSLLGISSQTHEFLLHADAGDTYAYPHGPHAHDAEEEPGHERSALHGLLHQTCGTHCAWISGVVITAFAPGLAVAFIADDTVRRIPSSDLVAPFRPPIRG